MAGARRFPVVVLLGPSGAGKTAVAEALRDARGWWWIEADKFPEDGIHLARLDEPWAALFEGNPLPLRNALRCRANAKGCPGAVLSVTSMVTLRADDLKKAAACGLHVLVLFGGMAECMLAVVKREALLNRGVDEAHWRQHNKPFYPYFEAPEIEPFRIVTFTTNGEHRSLSELVEEVVARTTAHRERRRE
jgi:hypothetical protein